MWNLVQQDLMLHKSIVSEFITNAPNNFLVVVMTSYYNDLVVIATLILTLNPSSKLLYSNLNVLPSFKIRPYLIL